MASTNPLDKVSVISLFVEDVPAAKTFYLSIFDASVVFEDEHSACVRLSNLMINLLHAPEGAVLVAPAAVGGPESPRRFQLTVFVEDLDVVIQHLAAKNVKLLTGPQVQPWGVKTVTFMDPAGHSWEAAQRTT